MRRDLKCWITLGIRASAFALFATGLIACISWLAGMPELMRIIGASAQIQFVTALLFCFAAAGLIALASRRPALAFYPAAVLLMLGAATLAEYATASSFVLDTLFPAAPPTALNPFPGRMAASTALAFALIGLTQSILASGGRRAWLLGAAAMLAAFVISIGVETIIGYALAMPTAFVWAGQVGMALITAICFTVLGVATILSTVLVSRAADLSAIPWVAATVGVAMAGLTGLLGQAAIAQYAPTVAPDAVYAMFALGLFVSVIVAATLAQVRHASFQAKALALANASLQQALDQRQIFMALVENSSDFIGIANPAGVPVYVNPAGRRLVGLPPDTPLEATRIAEYYTPDQRQFAKDVILKEMLERGHWQGETTFRHWQDDSAIPVSDEHFMIRDSASGRLLGMGTVTRDITQITAVKKEALAAAERLRLAHGELSAAYEKTRELAATLELERDRLNEAQAARHVGSWDIDLQHDVVTWSAEAYRILQADPAAVVPSREAFLERIHPVDRPRVEEVRAAALVERGSFHVEYRLQRSDGSERLLLEIGKVFCGQDGRPTRSVGTICDVTEERQADEALRQAGAVFAATNEGIFITDSQSRVIRVNPAFSRITGFGFDEVSGENPRIWSSGRQDREFYKSMWTAIEATGQWEGEMWNRRKSGEIYPCWQNISAVHDEHGKVSHYVSIFTDITVAKAAEAQLQQLAHHDMLTGLANRVLFGANLDSSLERARRHANRVGLMLLDLDRFKLINDTLGHAAGDELLLEIARRLKGCVRAEDTVARLGGDEFAVIAGDLTKPEDTVPLAKKIIEAIAKPIQLDGKEIFTSTSIGIGLYPDDAQSPADLLRAADAAMYRAKAHGRGTYDFYTSELSELAAEHLSLERDLRGAIARGELALVYQPQLDVANGRIVGAEALLRWRHPQRGLLMPDSFVRIAEDSGLIHPIGDWVLTAAMDQARAWAAMGLPLERIAVNVSGRQILHDHIDQTLTRLLQHQDGKPDGVRLEVEVTENVLLAYEPSAKVLNRMRDCGAMIAIDDFGTGYSSLSRLYHLPIDTLKIDRSFVQGLPDSAISRAISSAIIAMGHGLGLEVIAEGVETKAQLDFLRELGCNEVQGFFISVPLEAGAMEALLRAHPHV
jgi:diguanylate cyclase (GGDEF)-like protein/PAS domain S-box-containing protein